MLIFIIIAYIFIVWLESRRIEAKKTYRIAKLLIVALSVISVVVFVDDYKYLYASMLLGAFLLTELIRLTENEELYKAIRACFWGLLSCLPWYLTGIYDYPIFIFSIYMLTYNTLLNIFRGLKWDYSGNTNIWYNKMYHDLTGQKPLFVMWCVVWVIAIATSVKNIL